MRAAACAALLLLLGCGGSEQIDLSLSPAPGMSSLLLAIDDGGELSLAAYVLRAGEPVELVAVPEYVGSYPVTITAVFSSLPLEALRLTPGPIQLADMGRPVPAGDVRLRTVVRGPVKEGWTELATLEPPLSEIKIHTESDDGCVAAGGCFTREGDAFSACVAPCPTPSPVAAPRPPRAPGLTPCPPGWRELEAKPGFWACDPYPEGGPASCPAGQAHFPGEPACRSVGPACPAGPFVDPLPSAPSVFAWAGAPAGGNGTQAAPYASIGSAMSAAQSGSVVVVGQGSYVESVLLKAGVSLIGACASGTRITPNSGPAVRATSGNVVVKNLSLAGATYGIDLSGPVVAQIDAVIVTRSPQEAVRVEHNANLKLNDVIVLDTGGFWLDEGRSEINRMVMERSVGGGVVAWKGTTIVRDAAIRNGVPKPDQYAGRGVSIESGANATLERVIVSHNRDLGILVLASTFTFSDLVVHGTRFQVKDQDWGDGLQIGDASTVRGQRLWARDDQRFEIMVIDAGSSLTLTDAILQDPLPRQRDGGLGGTLVVQGGATASVSRALFSGSRDHAVHAFESDTRLFLEDATFLDLLAHQDDQRGASGIRIEGGARGSVARVRMERVLGEGLSMREIGTQVQIADIDIVDSGSGDCFVCGGICTFAGGRTLKAERLRVEGAHGRALAVAADMSFIDAYDVEVIGTHRSGTCVLQDPVSSPRQGDGIAAIDSGEVHVRRFISRDNESAGANVEQYFQESDTDTSMDLSDGELRNNAIGAQVLIKAYDPRRLADRVLYKDNRKVLFLDE